MPYLLTDDGELSSGRDFHVYAAGMDASLAVKLADIAPHLRPGFVVDKGCGTGTLLLELSRLFPASRFVGMDLSPELLRIANGQPYPGSNVSIVQGDIVGRHHPPGSVDTALFSSVLHEVYTYSGYDRDQVRLALKNTHTELRRNGRVVIRDGVSPGPGRVWMRCDAETEARFRRFAVDFKQPSPAPGVAFEERQLDGQTWFTLGLHEANEFLSKKDYLANWAIEVREEFGVLTLADWQLELAALGFKVIEARAYVNPWIRDHRYQARVWLYADDGGRPGPKLPYPDTTAVLVGEAVW